MARNACVLIAMQPEPGHIIPTVPVATALLEAGYSVVYLTSPTLAVHLRGRGFLAEAFGKTNRDLHPATLEWKSTAYEIVNSGRSYWQQFGHGAVRASFIEGSVHRLARTYEPSLILVDHLFFRNHKLFASCEVQGIPVLHVATSMPRWDEPETDSTVPRWVLCPADLELGCFLPRYKNITFGEPSIDWGRHEALFSGVNLRPGKPLILYSPGTQIMMHVNANDRLSHVLTAAQNLRECDFVIATGTDAGPPLQRPIPPNVSIVSHIPQLTLLKQASLLITHGGLGSVKEALCCGVPLLAMPVVFDQPYNAMRVRKKCLGEALFPDKVSAETIQSAIQKLLDTHQIRLSVKEMRERFLAHENTRPFVHMLIGKLTQNV